MSSPAPTRIRAAMGFGGLDNLGLANTGGIVLKGLSTTAYLTDPPVPAADLGTILTSFNAAIQALPNGGPAAEAAVDKYREQLIHALKMDALYAQSNCNNDLTIFLEVGERVSRLESGQSWFKGLWTALAGAWAYLIRKQ